MLVKCFDKQPIYTELLTLQTRKTQVTRYGISNNLSVMKACVEVALKHKKIGSEFKAYLKEVIAKLI